MKLGCWAYFVIPSRYPLGDVSKLCGTKKFYDYIEKKIMLKEIEDVRLHWIILNRNYFYKKNIVFVRTITLSYFFRKQLKQESKQDVDNKVFHFKTWLMKIFRFFLKNFRCVMRIFFNYSKNNFVES